jgi:hypothetical protein
MLMQVGNRNCRGAVDPRCAMQVQSVPSYQDLLNCTHTLRQLRQKFKAIKISHRQIREAKAGFVRCTPLLLDRPFLAILFGLKAENRRDTQRFQLVEIVLSKRSRADEQVRNDAVTFHVRNKGTPSDKSGGEKSMQTLWSSDNRGESLSRYRSLETRIETFSFQNATDDCLSGQRRWCKRGLRRADPEEKFVLRA